MPNTEDVVNHIVAKTKSRLTSELNKVDLKVIWYDLSKTQGEEEFAKDLAAIANTPGGPGYILIGLDENGNVYDAPFSNCNVKNEADLQTKMLKRIQPRVEWKLEELIVEGKRVSAITIAKSTARPHVVTRYKDKENYIPVRYGTRTNTASRMDLDDMFADRSVSQQSVLVPVSSLMLQIGGQDDEGYVRDDALRLKVSLITGIRPVVITTAKITIATLEWEIDYDLNNVDVRGVHSELPHAFSAAQAHIFELEFYGYNGQIPSDLKDFVSCDVRYHLVATQAEGDPFSVRCRDRIVMSYVR